MQRTRPTPETRLNHPSRRSVLGAAIGCALVPTTTAALAAGYPDKPVKIVVGFAAGGGADLLARQLGARLGEQTGQQFLVDNKPGATGTIAAAMVAKSPADGYTVILCSQSTMVMGPAMYPRLPFDATRDFIPVTQLIDMPMLLVVGNEVKARDGKELLALMKAGGVTYASAGLGGPQHMAMALFEQQTRTKLNHVPYKGEAPALTDVMGGQVTMMFSSLPVVLPFVKAGKLRVIGTSAGKRDPRLPDMPTVAEASGLPEFDVQTWYGLFAPAGTPEAVTRKLQEESTKAVHSAELAPKLTEQGFTPVGSDRAAFSRFMASETQRWSRLAKDIDLKAE
jgi:tripartite-type tricarboxylate transporter receptor subunit TctC